MILVRISDGPYRMHRAFNDLDQAIRTAEAFAAAGFTVAVVSAPGQCLLPVESRGRPGAP
jgi:hypothetical protein